MNNVEFRFATSENVPEMRALLTECGLSTDGVEALVDNFNLATSASRLVGTVALEPCGHWALLRSLAVTPGCRGTSLGRKLCEKAVSHPRLLGADKLCLLTTDAGQYFTRLGFKRVDRAETSAEIQQTAQFRSACPKTAACMARDIVNEVIDASSELLRLRADVPGARMWAVSLKRTMLTYFEVEPNSRFAPHSHESEQITMVLSEELFFDVGGVVHGIKAGEVIAIPSSVPHSVWTETTPVTAVDAWSPVMAKYEALPAG